MKKPKPNKRSPMNKEEIYDAKIAPLMTRIISVCKKNKIAMVASFSIPTEEAADLECTTALLEKDFDPPAKLVEAMNVIRPPARAPLMVTTRNAAGQITNMTAIL